MNRLFATFAAAALALACLATGIPKGTDVKLAFDQKLSSKTAHVGDEVKLHVLDDVIVDGQIVIRKGTAATGVVTSIQKGRRFGVNARMKLTLSPLLAVDGTRVPIAPAGKGKMTGSGTDKAALASGAGALVLGPIGLGIGYFVTGKEVKVKEGDTLATEVTATTELKTSATPNSAQNTAKGSGGR